MTLRRSSILKGRPSMRLALNFQKIDPARGGAETYVVDLCHRLTMAGHDVDLFAEDWKADALPAKLRAIRVPVSGWTRWGRTWSFAQNSERALRRVDAEYDCTIGMINTWHHDVIIPQGGVQAATLIANSKRFPSGWRRPAYIVGKQANPKAWVYRAIEHRQYERTRNARVVAVSQMVRGDLERHHGVSRDRIHVIPNAIDAGRLTVSDPTGSRREFRGKHGLRPDDLVALFVGHNYWLKGLKPLLLAMRERLRRDPSTRPISLLACGGGNPDRSGRWFATSVWTDSSTCSDFKRIFGPASMLATSLRFRPIMTPVRWSSSRLWPVACR